MTEASLVKFVRFPCQGRDCGFRCHVCGNTFRVVWYAFFSFSEKYDYGLNLCEACILALADEVKVANAGDKPQ
jgi:hypothetical protein